MKNDLYNSGSNIFRLYSGKKHEIRLDKDRLCHPTLFYEGLLKKLSMAPSMTKPVDRFNWALDRICLWDHSTTQVWLSRKEQWSYESPLQSYQVNADHLGKLDVELEALVQALNRIEIMIPYNISIAELLVRRLSCCPRRAISFPADLVRDNIIRHLTAPLTPRLVRYG
ncbi:hypothetical protein GCM10023116_16080 [Kistimonas scapharcae]|uniref:Uncharacterized protein n=1 Tax=Kistimonas scapharcae TaxID=1036133 RepID=A0ABP8V1P7_9GAMM